MISEGLPPPQAESNQPIRKLRNRARQVPSDGRFAIGRKLRLELDMALSLLELNALGSCFET